MAASPPQDPREQQEGYTEGDGVQDYMDDLSLFLPPEEEDAKKAKGHKGRAPMARQSGNSSGSKGSSAAGAKLPWHEVRVMRLEKRKEEARLRMEEEEQVLREGLAVPIDSSNIGFRLLQKMGFAADDKASAQNLPVGIELKRDRLGLGRGDVEEEERRKRRREEKEMEEMRKVQAERRRQQFGDATRGRWQLGKVRREFKMGASAALHLLEGVPPGQKGKGEDRGCKTPQIVREIISAAEHDALRRGREWEGEVEGGLEAEARRREEKGEGRREKGVSSQRFWALDDGDEDASVLPSRGGYAELADRRRGKEGVSLRVRWGEVEGEEYDGGALEEGEEFGRQRGAGAQGREDGTGGKEDEQAEGWTALLDRVTPDVLADLLNWLRDTYYYCIFCGHQYPSAKALAEECPGKDDEDH